MFKIDALAHNNALKKVHAGEKLAFSLLAIAFAISFKNIYVSLIIISVNLWLTVFKAKIPANHYFKLLTLPLGFLIVALLPLIITFSNFTPTLAYDALPGILKLALSSFAALTAMYFLALTTPFTSLAAVFGKLYIPNLLIELMLLIYRFIFVLMETTYEMTTAQKSRLGYSGVKNSYRSLAMLVTNLFFSSYRRANEAFVAMTARNYTGNMNVLNFEDQVSPLNIIGIGFYFIVLTAVAVYGGL